MKHFGELDIGLVDKKEKRLVFKSDMLDDFLEMFVPILERVQVFIFQVVESVGLNVAGESGHSLSAHSPDAH